MDTNGDCNGCKFWEQNHSGLGWCHRLPPKDNVSRHDDDRRGFVVTTCEDWCGEYQISKFQEECEAGLYNEEIAAMTDAGKPEAPTSAGVATNG